MKDKETGSLSAKPFLELLLDFYNGSVTGSLKLERAPLQKAVYFRDGQILFAASNDPKDQLASILVEEGKLGPEQMQVAQARVGPGSPLAKVLTELGYISQRELADAARLKVEKILTDLYSWNEGTYQFATKSLPKGAIDLELSTPHVLLNSMRRIQDRQWVLRKLESLESVMVTGIRFEDFLAETHADEAATEVLRLADGARSVKDIAASVSLGEFEVCKILSAGLVLGALELKAGSSLPAASEDAFDVSINAEAPPSFEADSPTPVFTAPESTVFDASPVDAGSDTTAFDSEPLRTSSVEEAPEPGTMFSPAEQAQKSPSSLGFGGDDDPLSSPPPVPGLGSGTPEMSASFESLNIHDPEPVNEDEEGMVISRKPPVPKRRGGSAVSTILRAGLAVMALAGIGAALYYFVWPMVFPADTAATNAPPAKTAGGGAPAPQGKTRIPINTPPPDRGGNSTSPEDAARGSTTPTPVTAPPTTTPRPTPRPTSTAPVAAPPTSSTPPKPAPRPAPSPPRNTGGGSRGSGRQLLASGNLRQASQSFLRELSGTPNKFTIAVGLYCNETNAARTVENAGNSADLYVLPAQLQGRSCYRVLWGLFDSREAASGAMGSIPGSIRSGDSTPVPVNRFLN